MPFSFLSDIFSSFRLSDITKRKYNYKKIIIIRYNNNINKIIKIPHKYYDWLNPLHATGLFLYLLKTSQAFCFQGVYKMTNDIKWVKRLS